MYRSLRGGFGAGIHTALARVEAAETATADASAARDAALAVPTASIADECAREGITGRQLGERIHAARAQAIAQALQLPSGH